MISLNAWTTSPISICFALALASAGRTSIIEAAALGRFLPEGVANPARTSPRASQRPSTFLYRVSDRDQRRLPDQLGRT
jgi:hypothetical protein